MNAIQGMEVTAAGGSAHSADASATGGTSEQRENTRAALIKKYENMLNIAELIVSFQLSTLRNHEQKKP